jgi:hypothetical protein
VVKRGKSLSNKDLIRIRIFGDGIRTEFHRIRDEFTKSD